jgi:hypothetical protein
VFVAVELNDYGAPLDLLWKDEIWLVVILPEFEGNFELGACT